MIIDVLTKFCENDKNLLNPLEAFTNRHDVFLNVFAFQIIEDTIDFHTEVLDFYAEILGALGCPLDWNASTIYMDTKFNLRKP